MAREGDDDPDNFIRPPYSFTNNESISAHRQDKAAGSLGQSLVSASNVGVDFSAAVHRQNSTQIEQALMTP